MICFCFATASFADDSGVYRELLFEKNFIELSRVEAELQSNRELSDRDLTELDRFYREVGGYRLSSEEAWQSRKELIFEWIEAQPESDAAILALGLHYYRYGWYLRGTSVRNKLDMTQVVPFADYMGRALKRALSVSSDATKNPAWWQLILGIAVAQGWPQPIFNVTYERAVERFPWYLPYHLFKSQYVSQRWYGSHESLAEFTESSAKRFPEYFGNRMYARLQWHMRLNDMFENGQTKWPLVRDSFQSIVAKYPERQNYMEFAILACLARDGRTLKELMPLVAPPPTPTEWNTRLYQY
ncbi:MAG: DUF4034 domain-containing protein, partial [Pseudomonadales bacterium]|nr:DUF4034 domain-containing protein [Pseudomonadales bacterium]